MRVGKEEKKLYAFFAFLIFMKSGFSISETGILILVPSFEEDGV